jgi:predicted AAA+ superfamily ATPase
VQDLLVWRDSRLSPPELFHWRTHKGAEVDIVIQDGDALLPIEVKATSQPSTRDLASIRRFMTEYEDRAIGGLFLHTGQDVFWVSDRVLAVPWWRVL